MNKICISCGMPMEVPEDFPKQDTSKDYCCYCSKPNGEMQSYDERLENYSGWLIKTQGLTKAAAISQSKIIMSQLPAWKSVTIKE